MRTDTSRNMSWSALEVFLGEQDFQILQADAFNEHGATNHRFIAAHVQRKLLLHAVSFNWKEGGGEVINNCDLYGFIRRRDGVSSHDFLEAVNAAGSIWQIARYEIYSLELSYTTPLAARLASLEAVGEFINWGKSRNTGGWTPRRCLLSAGRFISFQPSSAQQLASYWGSK